MARIRSVKPEFWTDPDVVALPMAARLLFIGSWNHADDYGVLKDDPHRLKLQVLPADDIDPDELVDMLVESNHLLRRIAPDGTRVLVIRTFCDHQKIDRRSLGRWGHPDDFQPPPTVPAESPPIPTNPSESPPRKGTEGNGTEGTSTNPVPPESSKALALVPHEASPPATDPVEQVFHAWLETNGRTQRTVLDRKRRAKITNALKQYPLDDVLDAVRGWQHSPHHRGENDQGTVYNDLELLLRDPTHVERFRDFWRQPPRARGRPSSVSTGFSNIANVLGGAS
jgi:hypothetical protein